MAWLPSWALGVLKVLLGSVSLLLRIQFCTCRCSSCGGCLFLDPSCVSSSGRDLALLAVCFVCVRSFGGLGGRILSHLYGRWTWAHLASGPLCHSRFPFRSYLCWSSFPPCIIGRGNGLLLPSLRFCPRCLLVGVFFGLNVLTPSFSLILGGAIFLALGPALVRLSAGVTCFERLGSSLSSSLEAVF